MDASPATASLEGTDVKPIVVEIRYTCTVLYDDNIVLCRVCVWGGVLAMPVCAVYVRVYESCTAILCGGGIVVLVCIFTCMVYVYVLFK